MAKKITVLLVVVFVLILSSVTAFAVEPESTSPEAGFTKEEIPSAPETVNTPELADVTKTVVVDEILEVPEIDVSVLEEKYSDIFLDASAVSETSYISLKYLREKDKENELRYNFTGCLDNPEAAPIVMLMYIKINDVYVPLMSVDTGTNITEGTVLTCSKVDLAYLGPNKVNEVRVIVFKKSDLDNLSIENIQIKDMQITVRPWNVVEKAIIKLTTIIDDITKPAP